VELQLDHLVHVRGAVGFEQVDDPDKNSASEFFLGGTMGAPISYPYVSLGIITVTTAGTPVQASSTSLKVRAVWLSAIKAKGTPNSGTFAYVLDPNSKLLFAVPKSLAPLFVSSKLAVTSDFIDLSNWWIDADTSGDGLLITYQL
jgi:hypothetical protein